MGYHLFNLWEACKLISCFYMLHIGLCTVGFRCRSRQNHNITENIYILFISYCWLQSELDRADLVVRAASPKRLGSRQSCSYVNWCSGRSVTARILLLLAAMWPRSQGAGTACEDLSRCQLWKVSSCHPKALDVCFFCLHF